MVWLKWLIARPSSILTKSGNSLKTVDAPYPVQLLSCDSGRRRGITAIIEPFGERPPPVRSQATCVRDDPLANSALKEWLGGKHAA